MNKLTIVLVFILTLTIGVVRAQEWSLIVRVNPAVDEILPADAKVEKLVSGFGYIKGPVWVRKGGYLLFSDAPANVIYKWIPNNDKVSPFLTYSGFTGSDDSGVGVQHSNGHTIITEIGSSDIAVDPKGRIVYCASGDRQIVRIEEDGRRSVVADRFEGKRFNSPHDLVYKSDGALYFTDIPSGLRGRLNDPKRELRFDGVFLLKDGTINLLTKDLEIPDGLAFSPDEKYIYISDSEKRIIWRFEVQPDDTLANGRKFADMSGDIAPGNADGLKVDRKGNVYATGPGGLWIFSPEGRHLGTILTSEVAANLAFGGPDGQTLFITGRTGLYKLRVKIPGGRL